MGRISRSFQLMGQSYRVLMQDKELMVLPLISGTFIAVVAASFAFGFGIDSPKTLREGGLATYVPMFFLYVVTYTVGIFFQAAVIAGATARMRGENPTVSSALVAAGSRIGQIVLWAVVAATVGMILRAIQERVGFVGRIIVGILGAAWSLATFFVVPVLVLEDRTVHQSFSRSIEVFKKTWGETVVGGINLGVAAMCAWFTLIAATGLLTMVIGVWAVAVFAVGAAFLMVFFSALQGVYIASLYRYATEGQASGFDKAIFEQAFVAKRK